MEKYLLCRPLGGLNDVLCQITNCYNYCKRTSRTLLLDTEFDTFFLRSFDTYFLFNDQIEIKIIYNTMQIRTIIENIIYKKDLTIYPEYIKDKIYNYAVEWKHDGRYFKNTDIKTKIDLKLDYKEDLILYHSEGGGEGSLQIIKYLKLNSDIKDEFTLRYNQVTKPYLSIHIRNTDYKTDYISIYNDNIDLINLSNIFLATDSQDVKNFFSEKNIKLKNFVNLPNNNLPIHNRYNNLDRHKVMIDTICDLLILALGDKFILPKKYYGFTKLAYNLFNNKKLVHNLIE
jgi:hypothetical protein